jgi:hypothetical protein
MRIVITHRLNHYLLLESGHLRSTKRDTRESFFESSQMMAILMARLRKKAYDSILTKYVGGFIENLIIALNARHTDIHRPERWHNTQESKQFSHKILFENISTSYKHRPPAVFIEGEQYA